MRATPGTRQRIEPLGVDPERPDRQRSCRLRQARSKSNIAGRIEARRFDALDATDDALKAAFVDEVLEQDDEGCRLGECALLERARGGLPVWRMDCGNN